MIEDLTGKILISMPGIEDSRFARALILVCAHEPDYAMGIVLNKPTEDAVLSVAPSGLIADLWCIRATFTATAPRWISATISA